MGVLKWQSRSKTASQTWSTWSSRFRAFSDFSVCLGGKPELLRNEMKRVSYDIIGISEVRWTGKGETPAGYFIWSGEEKMHRKGVGFLLSPQAKKALIGYNPINSWIISARFEATPFNITVIHAYALTSASSEEDIDSFYSDLDDAIAKTGKKDVIILTGDWNAKVGNDNTD